MCMFVRAHVRACLKGGPWALIWRKHISSGHGAASGPCREVRLWHRATTWGATRVLPRGAVGRVGEAASRGRSAVMCPHAACTRTHTHNVTCGGAPGPLLLSHSSTHSTLTHPPTHPLTHSLTRSLTHSRFHSLTHSLTHSPRSSPYTSSVPAPVLAHSCMEVGTACRLWVHSSATRIPWPADSVSHLQRAQVVVVVVVVCGVVCVHGACPGCNGGGGVWCGASCVLGACAGSALPCTVLGRRRGTGPTATWQQQGCAHSPFDHALTCHR